MKLKKVWAVCTYEGEFEVFNTEREADKFQTKELGDKESEYSSITPVYLNTKEDMEEIFNAGRRSDRNILGHDCTFEQWLSRQPKAEQQT